MFFAKLIVYKKMFLLFCFQSHSGNGNNLKLQGLTRFNCVMSMSHFLFQVSDLSTACM